MFKRARIKLTAWYLLIIMFVSLAFSLVIFRAANQELSRFAEAQRSKFERRFYVPGYPSELRIIQPVVVDDELLSDARARILLNLAIINMCILGLASVLGYYLSGKTLAPIQEMMDEQYRFISDASHELKTPITAIKTSLEVAKRDKQLDLAEAKKTLDISLEEINRMQSLAEGLLELTHKKSVAQLERESIKVVVEEALKVVEPLAMQKNIAIKTKVTPTIAMIDKASMTRVLLVILDNGVKYSPKNSNININSKIVGKNVIIQIKDQGIGIETKDLPHVFDRFYRSDTARSSTGYGLGLSIAKQIVEEHNGSIKVESKIQRGTLVSIALPYSAKIQPAKLR